MAPVSTANILLLISAALSAFSNHAGVDAFETSRGRGGFGKPTAVERSRTAKGNKAPSTPRVETINLGRGKEVRLFVPPDALNQQLKSGKARSSADLTEFYGTGDVLWPASLSLARLIAHCPSFVDGRDVLELGCGLGLVGAAATSHASPNHVALTDRDDAVLARAYASCTQLCKPSASVSRTAMDWDDPETWPRQTYDVVLASDVLYDAKSLRSLVNVLKTYLSGDSDDEKLKRALIVDPINRRNREAFCYAAAKAGLDADPVPFPGMEDDFVLINVTPRG